MTDPSQTAPIATPAMPIIPVTERIVACDGGGEPFGHPRVFLKIENTDIACPYCSRHYQLVGGIAADGSH